MEDARQFFLERYERFYHSLLESPQKGNWAFRYAVCRKENEIPIGYVHLTGDDSHDLGYGLKLSPGCNLKSCARMRNRQIREYDPTKRRKNQGKMPGAKKC